MKISVSNIAWGNKSLIYFLEYIRKLGCSGVEIAPSVIWPEPIKSSKEERMNFLDSVKKTDLELVGFHSLLYNRPDLQLFLNKDSRNATKDYICDLASMCSELGGKQLIFGSPKNRLLHGKKYDECVKQATEDFFEVAEFSKKKNVFFCIEPLGRDETEFIQSLKEGGDMVKKINHPYFKLHLDSKAIFSTKENPHEITKNYKQFLQHVHVGDKNLLEPGTVNTDHYKIGAALRNINYSKYISIEMRENDKDVESSLTRSISYVKKNYLGEGDE